MSVAGPPQGAKAPSGGSAVREATSVGAILELDDARGGKFVDNLTGFGRALRRAGVPVDSSRMALASEAALMVGLAQRDDVSAALEAVLVSREQDRLVFRELFDGYFRDPADDGAPPALRLASAEGPAQAGLHRPRVGEALAPRPAFARQGQAESRDTEPAFDAAMTASDLARLKHADFSALGAGEYRLVERLAREIRLPLPEFAARRVRPGTRGARLHWPGVMHNAAGSGGEFVRLPRLQRRHTAFPLLVLLDVSGSMERYARLLLAFLHEIGRAHV